MSTRNFDCEPWINQTQYKTLHEAGFNLSSHPDGKQAIWKRGKLTLTYLLTNLVSPPLLADHIAAVSRLQEKKRILDLLLDA